jgi:uncharacterized protein (DUF2141 family)
MRGRARASLSILLAFAATVSAIAQAPPRQPPPPMNGTGILAGQVVDPGTGKPVPEAVVTLWFSGIAEAGPRVMADSQGRFVFVSAPAGKYHLHAQKGGYFAGYFGQRTADGSTSAVIELADAQILADLVVPAWKGSAISGTVTDEAGQPVVGVRVGAFKKTILYGEVQLVPQDRFGDGATTDDRGTFRVSNLPPGEYAVAMPTTLTTFPVDVMPATQTVGPIRSQAFFALGDTAGPLGDARNQAVGDAVLLIDGTTAFPPSPTGSNVALVYRTTFAPGTPRPAEATTVALHSGDEQTLDIALKPSRAVRVSGRLVGPDGPLAHTPTSLIATGTFQTGISVYPRDGATVSALTDGQGRFTFLGVPEGDYIVAMRTGEPQVGFISASQPITVGGVDIADVTVTARRSTRITGRFEMRSGMSAEAVYVFGEPMEAGLAQFLVRPRNAVQNFEGSAPPGRYAVSVRSPVGVSCTATVAGRDVTDEVFLVGTDPIEMTVVCGDPAASLRGTARKDYGAADPDAAIVAFPAERAFWRGATFRPRRFMQALSDKSGAFTLANLPPGEYFVAAIPIDKSVLWQDPKFLEALTRSATRIALAQGESRTADLRTVQIK